MQVIVCQAGLYSHAVFSNINLKVLVHITHVSTTHTHRFCQTQSHILKIPCQVLYNILHYMITFWTFEWLQDEHVQLSRGKQYCICCMQW